MGHAMIGLTNRATAAAFVFAIFVIAGAPAQAQSTSGGSTSPSSGSTAGGHHGGSTGVDITIDIGSLFGGRHEDAPTRTRWDKLDKLEGPVLGADGGLVVYIPPIPPIGETPGTPADPEKAKALEHLRTLTEMPKGLRIDTSDNPPRAEGTYLRGVPLKNLISTESATGGAGGPGGAGGSGGLVIIPFEGPKGTIPPDQRTYPAGQPPATEPPATSQPAAAAPCPPCPPREEVEKLQTQLAAAKSERDKLAAENQKLQGQIKQAQAQASDAQKAAAQQAAAAQAAQQAAQASHRPGDSAKAVYIPIGITQSGDREIDHQGWDIIRLYISGNQITLANLLEQYLKDNPEIPPDQVAWLRQNYGTIPTGGFDFGTLPDGSTVQDSLAHLCQPEPDPATIALMKQKAATTPDGKYSIAHEFSISQYNSTQRVTKGGQTYQQASVSESVFNISLSAECLWEYDSKSHELKKRYTMSLSVQWTDQNHNLHEVHYSSQDPQMGWVLE